MATEPVFEAINWNKIQDDKDLEVWDRLRFVDEVTSGVCGAVSYAP